MAPIAGRPFLAYLLQYLEISGMRRIILAVGHQHEVIRSFFGSRYRGMELHYSVEEEPLGTGGALLQGIQQVQSPFVFVLNGDTFLRLDYRRMSSIIQREPEAQLVVALRRVKDASRFGAALVAHGRIEGFSARGTQGGGLINAGSYLVTQRIFDRYSMPRKFSWEQDFLETRAAEIRPHAYECDVPFLDIGIPEALEQAQTLIPEWTGHIGTGGLTGQTLR